MSGQHSLGLPWRLPFYERLNGFHPLVESFIKDNPSIGSTLIERATQLNEQSADLVLLQLAQQTRLIQPEFIPSFLSWLHLFDQLSIEQQAAQFDALFMHTTPLYCGNKPWLFHFESFPSIFMPFIFTGRTGGVSLNGQGYFNKIKSDFESEQCRAIFTHIRSSRDIFDTVFNSPAISRKLHYVPLGITGQPVEKALSKFFQPGKIRILFTNSLHQDAASFYIRGGHHLLKAFQLIRRDYAQIELTILSSAPNDLGKWFSDEDLIGVNWINQRVDDATLEQLYLTHHIFALPTAGLHSYSLLRAMSHGCVPLISDALGYEEYTEGVEDSLMKIQGVRAQVYRQHHEGWVTDDYAPFVAEPSADYISQIHAAILGHCDMLTLMQMASKNLHHCNLNFSQPDSHANFNRMLAEAV